MLKYADWKGAASVKQWNEIDQTNINCDSFD